jgi:hypothetical protein
MTDILESGQHAEAAGIAADNLELRPLQSKALDGGMHFLLGFGFGGLPGVVQMHEQAAVDLHRRRGIAGRGGDRVRGSRWHILDGSRRFRNFRRRSFGSGRSGGSSRLGRTLLLLLGPTLSFCGSFGGLRGLSHVGASTTFVIANTRAVTCPTCAVSEHSLVCPTRRSSGS